MDLPANLGRRQNEKEIDPLYFQVSGRLPRLLGADSVSDRFVAISELAKNAYDADAWEVTVSFEGIRTGNPSVTISDNGQGLGQYALEHDWMLIGTSSKERDPFTKKFHRRKIGHKGIGRFALQNLARIAEITCYPEGEETGYRAVFNWENYEAGNALVTTVANPAYSFPKKKSKHGFEIKLYDLRQPWDEDSLNELSRSLSLIIPPTVSGAKFSVRLEAPEFPKFRGKLKSTFLKLAVFTFKGSLQKDGQIHYVLTSPKGTTRYGDNMKEFTCGPVEFILYFYYRDEERWVESGIKVPDMDELTSILDDYGGVKLYRDNLRVTGFGEPDNDWLQLDALRVYEPGIVPSNKQLIGFVKITAENNPRIVDTTTREGIIGGKPFDDLRDFLRASIKYFADRRGELEGKHKKKPSRKRRELKKIKDALAAKKEPEKFIDFRPRYPEVFYKPLEEEINTAYNTKLPNATLVMTRKLVENLLYNILEYKFRSTVDLWYNTRERRAQDFSMLVKNLSTKKKKFTPDQRDIIDKLLSMVKPFRREANSKSHRILEYLDSPDELIRLKVPEIVELELKLIDKVRALEAT